MPPPTTNHQAMRDIRSYMEGKPPVSSGSSQKEKKPDPKKSTPQKTSKKRKQRVIDSDEEDMDNPKNAKVQITPKSTPKKSLDKRREKKPKLEDTDASTYFESSNKIKRTAMPAKKPVPAPVKKKPDFDEDEFIVDDDFEIDDEELMQEVEITKPTTARNGVKKENTMNKAAEVAPPVDKPKTPVKRKAAVKDEESSEDDEFLDPISAPKPDTSRRTPKKLKASEPATIKAQTKPAVKAAPKTTAQTTPKATKKTESKIEEEDAERKAILESVETVELPDTAPAAGDGKFNYRAMAARPGPQAPGSKEIPVGEEDCLTGLTFVFTGVLESIDRDDAVNLVKRYGGKVTGAPSSKTSYVVLGSDAGPKKIETIKKNNIRTISEDGLFQLIRTLPAHGGTGKAGQEAAKKKELEEKKIQEMAKEMEAQVKQQQKKVQAVKGATSIDNRLWTEKYAPVQIKEVIGNKGLVEKLQRWLRDWPKNVKANFKKPGPDGMGLYRSVCLSGPPGIGKTTSAHLCAKLEGYDILEYNASDTRNEKLLREKLAGVTDNTSISGFLKHEDPEDKGSNKLVLIMDEIDGMSGGDRGGVGALKKIIQTTRIPIICICNDRRHPKLKPLDRTVFDLSFRRPTANEVRSRIMMIAFREGLKLQPQVVDQFVEGTHSDIRQILNLLSTYRLSRDSLAFDESKKVVKDSEKYIILKPWDIAGRFLSSAMFHPTSKTTLNEKIELYFNDHEFSALMLQENYLKSNPDFAKNAGNIKEQNLKKLELAEKASESISNGDLVDAMIHGSQQQWSLMPTHAVFSCVTPAYYMHGNATGQYNFTSWLGNNSKQGKLYRLLREIQGHMRLRISGDRNEVRQSYLQTIFDRLVRKFAKDGADSIDEIIQLMDEYYLTKEDFDSIIELSLGPNNGEALMKDVPPNVKTAFTRKYNAASHPMAFQKAGGVVATKGGRKDRPDVEDAFEDSDEGEVAVEEEDAVADEDEEDLSKDKMIKEKKPKGKGAAAGATAKKAAPKKTKK